MLQRLVISMRTIHTGYLRFDFFMTKTHSTNEKQVRVLTGVDGQSNLPYVTYVATGVSSVLYGQQ